MRAVVVVVWFGVVACRGGGGGDHAAPPPDDGLPAAHDQILADHRARDWKALAPRDAVLDIRDGEIGRMSPAAGAARFKRYLERAEFTRYADLVPPIVRVAADGSLGWVIAQVRVEGTYRDDDGVRTPLDTTWAWVELYARTSTGWRMIAISSTRARGAEPVGLAGLSHPVDAGAATVLAAAEKALGGRAALAAVETLRTEAAVTTPRGRATTRIAATGDGRVRFEQVTPAGELVAISAIGERVRVGVGADAKPGTAAERGVAIGHALHILFAAPTRWLAGGRDAGASELAGQRTRALAFRDLAGNELRMHYATATGLPVGAELVEAGTQPPVPIRITVDDWRWLGPVRAFHRARFEHRGQRYEYEYTQIRFNDVDPAELAR